MNVLLIVDLFEYLLASHNAQWYTRHWFDDLDKLIAPVAHKPPEGRSGASNRER